jgi:hypothetical protein
VDLDTSEASPEHILSRLPPLAEQLRGDAASERPVKAALDATDAGKQPSDPHSDLLTNVVTTLAGITDKLEPPRRTTPVLLIASQAISSRP